MSITPVLPEVITTPSELVNSFVVVGLPEEYWKERAAKFINYTSDETKQIVTKDGFRLCIHVVPVYDNKVLEVSSVDSVAEYLESRLESLCNEKNTFYPNTERNSEKYAKIIATQRAMAWIAHKSRRGMGNRRYKNFIFYQHASLIYDRIFQIYRTDNVYSIYENPHSEYMVAKVAKVVERIDADLELLELKNDGLWLK